MKAGWKAVAMLISMMTILCSPILTRAAGANTRIAVFLNGSPLNMDVSPVIASARVLLPLRAVSEATGADSVVWSASAKSVTIKRGTRTIVVRLGSVDALIDNARVQIDAAPRLINGRVMVPARFIAENMNIPVAWDPDTRIVEIGRQIAPERLSAFRTSYFEEEFVKIEASGDKIIASGRFSCDEIDRVRLTARRAGSDSDARKPVSVSINPDNTFTVASQGFDEGAHIISIWTGYYICESKTRRKYSGVFRDAFTVVSTGDSLFFQPSAVHRNNAVRLRKPYNAADFTAMNIPNRQQERTIRELANRITQGLTDDYAKVLAINDWVATNIYYDFDAFTSGRATAHTAYDTLRTRRSVCEGYAQLANALLRAAGIPSKIVSGFARGVGMERTGWDELDHSRPNHAWNRAYVGGRWVVFDATWNSRNKFENGAFVTGPPMRAFFDMTVEFLSDRHKILGFDQG